MGFLVINNCVCVKEKDALKDVKVAVIEIENKGKKMMNKRREFSLCTLNFD